MDNSSKIILDLCGGTGAWSRPYKDAGYDVRLITLPEYDVTKVEFGRTELSASDIWFMGATKNTVIDARDVYGILAAPPCTQFSLASGNALRDFQTGMRVVEACLGLVWKCRILGRLKFWALENPVGFMRQFLGIPKNQFYQWQYGGDRDKRTDLWGYYNMPAPLVKERPDLIKNRYNRHCVGWTKIPCPPEYAHLNLSRAAVRAITPPGFAQAFYKANK